MTFDAAAAPDPAPRRTIRAAMNARKKRRLLLVALGAVVLSIAAALILVGMRDALTFYKTPTEIRALAGSGPAQRLRMGGLVKEGSLVRGEGANVRFEVGDGAVTVPVTFNGLLPDLFRENQIVIAEGRLGTDGVFAADTVLAKHDETYMPREVVDTLKKPTP